MRPKARIKGNLWHFFLGTKALKDEITTGWFGLRLGSFDCFNVPIINELRRNITGLLNPLKDERRYFDRETGN
jgi:hypothetical protein